MEKIQENHSSDGVNFHLYLNMLKNGRLTWEEFLQIMKDMTKNDYKKTEQLNMFLLHEFKGLKDENERLKSEKYLVDRSLEVAKKAIKEKNSSLRSNQFENVKVKEELKRKNDTINTLNTKNEELKKQVEEDENHHFKMVEECLEICKKKLQETNDKEAIKKQYENVLKTALFSIRRQKRNLSKNTCTVDSYKSDFCKLYNFCNFISCTKCMNLKNHFKSVHEGQRNHNELKRKLEDNNEVQKAQKIGSDFQTPIEKETKEKLG